MSQSVFNAYHSLTEEHEVAESSYSVRRLPMLHESRLTILRLKVKSIDTLQRSRMKCMNEYDL